MKCPCIFFLQKGTLFNVIFTIDAYIALKRILDKTTTDTNFVQPNSAHPTMYSHKFKISRF